MFSAMKPTRQTDATMTVERVFAPGRLEHQRMAAAYEKLVPIRRISRRQGFKVNSHCIQEERRWAL